ncbi:MAG: hypothetical protein GY774_21855 [Planctomycetes bacterium]|nr:hypothetical protein [Planctomycetota bacterium]
MIINFAKTGQISKIIFMSFVMLSMIGMLTGGCSAILETRYPEPTSIAVRNNSGISLSVVTLRGVRTSGDKQVRMGRISPVPRGATQVFNRPSSPPPLPVRIIISWTDSYQRQYEREISLEKILSDPNTQAKGSLIFEIRPSGRISVFRK